MNTSVGHEYVTEPDASFVAGQSPAIQRLNTMVVEIARTSIPVLLLGESGTGKEVYARLIHRLSESRHKPFVKLSCRTMESGEFVSKLREPLATEAESGSGDAKTIFLDGIDELEFACQTALLSLLPDGEPEDPNQNRARVIASTSRKLEKEVEGGRFRKELFFRINGVSLQLPPLRERKDDLPALLEYFLGKYGGRAAAGIATISDDEIELLRRYDWPGNIRELENFARKISFFGHTRSAIEDLRTFSRSTPECSTEESDLSLKVAARNASRQAEREIIRETLERTHWNRKRAAERLNISYKSLLYKIKQTGLVE